MNFHEKKRLREEISALGLQNPCRAFANQRESAKRRCIEWKMTFEEWWAIWQDYYHLRGKGTNGLCMARNGDVGAYEVGNVYLTTNLGNTQDYHKTEQAKIDRQKTRESNYTKRTSKVGIWCKSDYKVSGIPVIFKAKDDWDEIKNKNAESID